MLNHYRIYWSRSLNCWVILDGIMQSLSTDTEFRIPSNVTWVFYVDAELSTEMTPVFHLRTTGHPSLYAEERQFQRVYRLVSLFNGDVTVDGHVIFVEFPE